MIVWTGSNASGCDRPRITYLMRCVFCKSDSSHSRSVEHIIPESLGNLSHILPPGVVCDKCNNYFATKVEKPFLETDAIRQLRFQQSVRNKRGRVPEMEGVLLPGFPAILRKFPKSPFESFIELEPHAIRHLIASNGGKVILPYAVDPPDRLVSRFLAKAAVEAMAARLFHNVEWLDSFTDERQLDLIRNHARWGEVPNWPVYVRRIYDIDTKWADPNGQAIQVVHEFDIIKTGWDEWFFVLTLFGLELVINYGGPEIDGYQRWLKENQEQSTLYTSNEPSAKKVS